MKKHILVISIKKLKIRRHGFESRAVQAVTSRYNSYSTPAHIF